MTELLLIRHADTDFVGRALAGRAPGVHLTARGQQQAHALAARLCERPLHAIYSSPQQRALQTASAIAARRDQQVRVCEGANELSFGLWTGRSFSELSDDAHWRRWNAVRSCTRIPGGELMIEAQSRMIAAIDELHLSHDGQTVALISHADVIKAAIGYFLGMPLDLLQRLEISPASISVLTLEAHGPRVLSINDTR